MRYSKICGLALSAALSMSLVPGLALADGDGLGLFSADVSQQADAASQSAGKDTAADAPTTAAPADAKPDANKPKTQQEILKEITPKILDLLGNDTYRQTYDILAGGEVITQGTQSQAASGLQQTLVDFGFNLVVDGDAGALTFEALNNLLGTFKMGPVDTVDANLYAQILPWLLIAQKNDVAADVLQGYYGPAENQSPYDYAEGCVYVVLGKMYHAKEAFERSKYDDYQQRADGCALEWPGYGELWHNPGLYSQDMSLTFTVNSWDESLGRYFEVYTEWGELASTLFITGSGSVSTTLPGGNYRIRDSYGTEWYGMADAFGRSGHYSYMEFWEFENDPYLTALPAGYEWSITINVSEGTGASVGSESYSYDER